MPGARGAAATVCMLAVSLASALFAAAGHIAPAAICAARSCAARPGSRRTSATTSSSISRVMAPGRRMTAASPVTSTIVDSTPKRHGPPSRISGMRPARSSSTASAVVGLGLPDVLALGAARGKPAARIRASAASFSGMRTPTVLRPPVMRSGTAARRRSTKVRGPGANAARRCSAISGTSSATSSSMARCAMCRISGLSEGRPFAS